MIIDSHAHIGGLPDSPFAKTTFKQNMDLLLKEMKKNKVDRAFILPFPKKNKIVILSVVFLSRNESIISIYMAGPAPEMLRL